MPLIFLATLTPTNSLAAVRFSRPVHVSSLRIIPTSLAPFPELSDFFSETEPGSFSVEVFFNWQTLPSGNEKPRASNVLLHSTLQYTGNELEYEVDPSEQLVTRLLILKGSFASLTLAVYGRDASEPKPDEDMTVAEPAATSVAYNAVPLPELSHTPLPAAIDPNRIVHPLALPRRLLGPASSDADIIALMRRYLSGSPPSSSEITLDQVVYSYEIGEDWLKELIEVLEQPVDPSEIKEEDLQSIDERLLEIMSQSPSTETISKLILVLSQQSSVLVDRLLPVILESNLDPSLYLVLLNATSSSTVCDCLRSIGLPGDLDPPTRQRMEQNMHMWQTLRHGDVDMAWISNNFWLPGFLPSVLETLGTAEDLSAWTQNMKVKLVVATLLAIISRTEGAGGTEGQKAGAILEVWLTEAGILEILQEALAHNNIHDSLSHSTGERLFERVQSAALSANQRIGTAHRTNGHGGGTAMTGDLDAAASYLTSTSKEWPSESLQHLQGSLKTVLGRISSESDQRPVTHAFWRQNTSAVQCITLVLLEATRQLSDQNWELMDSTPARELVVAAQTSVQILHHMVAEFGLLSGMVPLVVRALISLIVGLRQPTYATRYSSEKSVRADCEHLIELMSEMESNGDFLHSGAEAILPVLLQDALRWDEGIDPLSRLTTATDILLVMLDIDHNSKPRAEAWAIQLIRELPTLHSLLTALDSTRAGQIVDTIRDIDDDEFGILEWLVLERLSSIEQESAVTGSDASKSSKEAAIAFADFRSERSLEFIRSLGASQLVDCMKRGASTASALAKALWSIWDRPLPGAVRLAEQVLAKDDYDDRLRPVSVAILLAANSTRETGNVALDLLPTLVPVLADLDTETVQRTDQLLRAVGAAIAYIPDLEEEITVEWQRGLGTLEAAITLLERALSFFPITEGVVTGIPVPTLSEGTAARFKGLVEVLLGGDKVELLTTLLARLSLPLIATPLPERKSIFPLVGSTLRTLVQAEVARPPTTPLSRPLSGLDGGLQTAPPSARKSSPMASLAKTYSNNDFRELRTLPQARLNTSRPPSRHVDDFEINPEVAVPIPSAIPAAIPGTVPVPGQLPAIPPPATNTIMPFYSA